MDLYYALILLVFAFVFLLHGFVDNGNRWRLHIASAFISSFLFFYNAWMLGGGVIKQAVGDTLVVFQPPLFGIVLWALGGFAFLCFVVWLLDFLTDSAKQTKLKKVI